MNMKKAVCNKDAVDLVNEILESTANGGEIPERLAYKLCNAKPSELSWDVFDALIEAPCEKNGGYWYATEVAATLLSPIINKRSNAGTSRITYGNQEDYISECKSEIRKRIPCYDRTKAKFPIYIAPWLKQVAFNFGMDATPYLMKKKNIQVFLQSTLVANKESAEGVKDDFAGYSNSELGSSAEEEYMRKSNRELGESMSKLVTLADGNSSDILCLGAMWAKLFGGAKNLPEGVVKNITISATIEFNNDEHPEGDENVAEKEDEKDDEVYAMS